MNNWNNPVKTECTGSISPASKTRVPSIFVIYETFPIHKICVPPSHLETKGRLNLMLFALLLLLLLLSLLLLLFLKMMKITMNVDRLIYVEGYLGQFPGG